MYNPGPIRGASASNTPFFNRGHEHMADALLELALLAPARLRPRFYSLAGYMRRVIAGPALADLNRLSNIANQIEGLGLHQADARLQADLNRLADAVRSIQRAPRPTRAVSPRPARALSAQQGVPAQSASRPMADAGHGAAHRVAHGNLWATIATNSRAISAWCQHNDDVAMRPLLLSLGFANTKYKSYQFRAIPEAPLPQRLRLYGACLAGGGIEAISDLHAILNLVPADVERVSLPTPPGKACHPLLQKYRDAVRPTSNAMYQQALAAWLGLGDAVAYLSMFHPESKDHTFDPRLQNGINIQDVPVAALAAIVVLLRAGHVDALATLGRHLQVMDIVQCGWVPSASALRQLQAAVAPWVLASAPVGHTTDTNGLEEPGRSKILAQRDVTLARKSPAPPASQNISYKPRPIVAPLPRTPPKFTGRRALDGNVLGLHKSLSPKPRPSPDLLLNLATAFHFADRQSDALAEPEPQAQLQAPEALGLPTLPDPTQLSAQRVEAMLPIAPPVLRRTSPVLPAALMPPAEAAAAPLTLSLAVPPTGVRIVDFERGGWCLRATPTQMRWLVALPQSLTSPQSIEVVGVNAAWLRGSQATFHALIAQPPERP